ncbi:DUF2634 domain-containing protein [Anaerosinus massiliensis]|uniref:DUF2634 domain-containing protein n=1 Tax=Massilibacillus massiliensis TaxID=1806837 RepID=UPI000DA62717|nr:DUF2634 domain-containing protein [Massilibacillus massiliensis]
MIPQATNITFPEEIRQPSKTYALSLRGQRITGMTDGLDAVKQAIEKIILTDRYAYLIYDWSYGIGVQKYIGKSFDYIKADIESTVGTALAIDDRILTINEVTLERAGVDSCYIKYNVTSTEGEATGSVKIL